MSKLKPSKIKKKLNKITQINFYFVGTVFIVLFIYFFSLFRPWQPFDERVFYEETLFPIPKTFNEVLEVLDLFVTNYHSESMNSFFSNHYLVRSNPYGASLVVFVLFLFKKNAILYHILQLAIHLLNTVLVWLIFKRTAKMFDLKGERIVYLSISFFTLLWALHSASTEAVLLVTNWDTILTYTICFIYILYEISSILDGHFKSSFFKKTFLSILFCLTMFFTEYAYSLPFVLFFIIFAFAYKSLKSFKAATLASFNLSLPYFIGLTLFALISLGKTDSPVAGLLNNQEVYVSVERNLWLVPQIFVHFLKLLFFPKTLSIYQPNHIHLADTLFEPYSIFCTLFYLSFIFFPVIGFLVFYLLKFLKKQDFLFIFPLVGAFYFALFPFLHILLPTYSLSADRYCYFPSFFALLILFGVFSLFIKDLNPNKIKVISIFSSLVLLLLSVRTFIRIQEWNDPGTLYKSAIKIEKNPLYKGHKLMIFADYIGTKGKETLMEKNLQNSLSELNKALNLYTNLKNKIKEQPITLKIYGLDYGSLLLKSAFDITAIRNDNYLELPKTTLAFYEPYIRERLDSAPINQIGLYAEILIKDNQIQKAKEALEAGLKRYPLSSELNYLLADVYFDHEKNLDKTYEVLKKVYAYFPNQNRVIQKLLKYYEQKGDLENQAKFSYLIGLREHSAESYLRAAQIYLDLGHLDPARKTLKKLVLLTGENPVTFLLTSRYLDLAGQKDKVLLALNSAYQVNKSYGENQDPSVTKSILNSLINVHIYYGNWERAEKYLLEFAQVQDLTAQEKIAIKDLKAKLNSLAKSFELKSMAMI